MKYKYEYLRPYAEQYSCSDFHSRHLSTNLLWRLYVNALNGASTMENM